MIETQRFILRPLCVNDVTDQYFSWLQDIAAQRFIINASLQKNLDDLRTYVAERESRDDILFLGIFTRSGDHIGNLKYEAINIETGSTIMGILIGETSWRGKGVALEVINASAIWLKSNKNIKRIELGVNMQNQAGIKAYKKLGFVEKKDDWAKDNLSQCVAMVWDL